MATTTITIQVETEAPKAFAAASPEEQRKMQLSPPPRLQDLTTPQGKPLQAVMVRDWCTRCSVWYYPKDLGVSAVA